MRKRKKGDNFEQLDTNYNADKMDSMKIFYWLPTQPERH